MRNNKINIKQAKLLIDKYYKGLTSKSEERQIAQFLESHPELKGLDAERAMFAYFAPYQKTPKLNINLYLKYSVAASILIFLSMMWLMQSPTEPTLYAYIDGQRITDQAQVEALIQRSIKHISADADIMEQSLEPFKKEQDLIEEQLEVFSDLEL